MGETEAQPVDTLPALQAVLDGLADGQVLHLTNADCERLFGVNDALVGRVANFARGHNCIVFWGGTGLTFRRQPWAAAGEPDA